MIECSRTGIQVVHQATSLRPAFELLGAEAGPVEQLYLWADQKRKLRRRYGYEDGWSE